MSNAYDTVDTYTQRSTGLLASQSSDFGSSSWFVRIRSLVKKRFRLFSKRPVSSLDVRKRSDTSDFEAYRPLQPCAPPEHMTVVMVDDARIAMVEHMYRSHIWDLTEELKSSTSGEINKIFLHAIGHLTRTDDTVFNDSYDILEFVRLATFVKKHLYVSENP